MKKNITIRIDEELLNDIDDLAERIGKSRIDVIEPILKQGVPEQRKMFNFVATPVGTQLMKIAASFDAKMDEEAILKALGSLHEYKDKQKAAKKKKKRK
jgi:hypothetical protein